jgi:hypothetical protein
MFTPQELLTELQDVVELEEDVEEQEDKDSAFWKLVGDYYPNMEA